MNKYPLLDINGDRIGQVTVTPECADAIADNWESMSIAATVLRGYTAAGEHNDQLIAFSLVVHPALEADRG